MRSVATAAKGSGQAAPKAVRGEVPGRRDDAGIPQQVTAAGSSATTIPTALSAASHAVAITENLRRGDAPPMRERTRRRHGPTGDFSQARDDGAVEEARRTLERRIRAHLPKGAVAVTLTDNRYTMISVRRETRRGPSYKVRLHHMFCDANPAITRALARYIAKNDRRSSHLLGDYIDANQHRVRDNRRRSSRPRITTRGEHQDLQEIFDDLNERYFGGGIEAAISWGQRSGKPRRRNSIKMGSYSVEDRFIRIHRSLDRAFVPRFFVEWIVFHEMLHQVHGVAVVNGRRQFHPKAFLEDEARFEHYQAARAWERAHLDELLTY